MGDPPDIGPKGPVPVGRLPNGVLLCSHHHHLIHKEQWQIEVAAEIPWN